jgi:hypothetical protein
MTPRCSNDNIVAFLFEKRLKVANLQVTIDFKRFSNQIRVIIEKCDWVQRLKNIELVTISSRKVFEINNLFIDGFIALVLLALHRI